MLVLTSESRAVSNRLWEAARERVGDLLVVGPQDTDEVLPAGQIALPTTGPRRNKLTFWHLQGLRGVINGFRPDLVHVNNELWGVTALEMLAMPQPFVVLGAENLFHSRGAVPRIRMGLADRVIARLCGYASWNQAGVDHVAARREPGFPTLVMPAIIPPAEFVPNSWKGQAEGDTRDVLLIGRLEEEKGFGRVIDAIGMLPDRERYLVHLCGTGPLADDLQASARRQGVPLEYHGFVTPSEVAELMTQMTCVIQPSQTVANWAEQFGRTVAEAMTVGVPCLVSDSGELPNVVNDPECVFPEADTATLSARIDWLCADADRVVAKGARQAQEARRWTPEVASAELVAFWTQALQHSRR